MTSGGENVALLGRALDQAAAVISAIPAAQGQLATPCPGWDVRALVQHLIGQDLRNFMIAVRGAAADWQAPADELGADWAEAFQARARQLLALWRAADPDEPIDLPGGGQVPLRSRADQQITELTVHAWDLVKATGQHDDLDPVLAEHALAWSHQMLRPESRGPGRAFGPEIPVPPDAPAYDRLAGWFGRDPGWTPPAGGAAGR